MKMLGIRRKYFYKVISIISVFILIWMFLNAYMQVTIGEESNRSSTISPCKSHKTAIRWKYLINYYNPIHFVWYRINFEKFSFDSCDYKNCEYTVDRNLLHESHAVMFQGRTLVEDDWYHRPSGQVWIFKEHEAPRDYERVSKAWKSGNWRSSFNWTMTYDHTNTDIYMPYGELVESPVREDRDFEAIYRNKTGQALLITSHCDTYSKRMEFVNELRKYIEVDVLGECGETWSCGKVHKHNDCFKILDRYKFYLSFENVFCRNYFTEKIYENFNYDTVFVTRGGLKGQANNRFPNNTIISTDDFTSVEELGEYLKALSASPKRYIEMLKSKSKYHFTGFKTVYTKALCNICERLNNIDKYRKQIPDIEEWAYGTRPCREVDDLHEDLTNE